MANNAKVTVNDATPVVVFSGTGNVMIIRATTGDVVLGGPSMTLSNGFPMYETFKMNVGSPDKIYGMCQSGTCDVFVLEVR